MVPRLLHKPVANEVGVAFRACPSDPSVLKIPHTHHHSYAMEGMQMRGHHEGEGVHHEGVGVAYRACGCGLHLRMDCDV